MRVAVFTSHPIQYQAPLWRALSRRAKLKVFFFSDHGVTPQVDAGFGVRMQWDQPLLEGYENEFLVKVPLERVGRSRIPNFSDFYEKEPFDIAVVHGYTFAFARQLIFNKRRAGYRLMLRGEFYDSPARRPWWRTIAREAYLRWFYGKVDHFLPIGTLSRKHLELRGVPSDRITVAPYCVDDKFFEAQRESHDRIVCRRELGISAQQLVFMFSGKLIPRKRPLLLAEALQHLWAEEFRFAAIIIGDGSERSHLEDTLRPLLGQSLIMPGFVNQSDLGHYYRAADVFVLPSIYETWGLVVNEAMHFGLPCVVSDRVGCGPDLVIPGRTGSVFRHDDVTCLTNRLRSYVTEPTMAATQGVAAHERIQSYTAAQAAETITHAIAAVIQIPSFRPNHPTERESDECR